jgi:hypothetical protein
MSRKSLEKRHWEANGRHWETEKETVGDNGRHWETWRHKKGDIGLHMGDRWETLGDKGEMKKRQRGHTGLMCQDKRKTRHLMGESHIFFLKRKGNRIRKLKIGDWQTSTDDLEQQQQISVCSCSEAAAATAAIL